MYIKEEITDPTNKKPKPNFKDKWSTNVKSKVGFAKNPLTN
jgi:hypothetical protein